MTKSLVDTLTWPASPDPKYVSIDVEQPAAGDSSGGSSESTDSDDCPNLDDKKIKQSLGHTDRLNLGVVGPGGSLNHCWVSSFER